MALIVGKITLTLVTMICRMKRTMAAHLRSWSGTSSGCSKQWRIAVNAGGTGALSGLSHTGSSAGGIASSRDGGLAVLVVPKAVGQMKEMLAPQRN